MNSRKLSHDDRMELQSKLPLLHKVPKNEPEFFMMLVTHNSLLRIAAGWVAYIFMDLSIFNFSPKFHNRPHEKNTRQYFSQTSEKNPLFFVWMILFSHT